MIDHIDLSMENGPCVDHTEHHGMRSDSGSSAPSVYGVTGEDQPTTDDGIEERMRIKKRNVFPERK